MKELIRILSGEGEQFSKKEIALYGILYPMAVVAACIVSSLI